MAKIIVYKKGNKYITNVKKDNFYKFGIETGEGLILNKYEIAYAIENNKCIIKINNKIISSFLDFIKYEDLSLKVYYVFKDIRNRGYIIKIDEEENILIYPKSSLENESPMWYCVPLYEEEYISWEKIDYYIKKAKSLQTGLILGILDKDLDVTYYYINYGRDFDR